MTWMTLVRSPGKIDMNSRELRLKMIQEPAQSSATEIVVVSRPIINNEIKRLGTLIVSSGRRIDRDQWAKIGTSFCSISKPRQNWAIVDRRARNKIVDSETFAMPKREDRDGFLAGGAAFEH